MNRLTAIGILKGFALTVLFLLAVPSARATSLIFDTRGNIIGSYAEASHTAINAAYGVNARSTGSVAVRGLNVPVAVERQVSKAAIAKAAGKIAAKAIPGVAAVATIAELCTLLCPSGDYRLSPDGAALQQPEKPGVPGDPAGTGYGVGNGPMAKNPSAVCPMLNSSDSSWDYKYTLSGNQCRGTMVRRTDGFTATAPNVYNIQKYLNWYVPDYILATEVQTEADVLARAEQQAKFKPLYDAIAADRGANPTSWPDAYEPIKPSTPVVISASPVSSSERVVSTTSKSLPDGSTDTTTTTEKTVVTPTTTGTTVGDSQTTFPSQTVTNNTTVNNVTNNTTTETTTVNHPADTTPTTPGETDNSPRECGTPGRPKCQIDETGTPVAPTAIDETTFDQIKEKNTEILDKVTQMTPESMGVSNWFPQIATAECVDPQVPNPISGEMKSVPICAPFNIFKTFVSSVLAFFCLLGCVREVQSAMKA